MDKRIIMLIALVVAVFVIPASAETLEIRGTVKEGTAANPLVGPAALTWDATNFAAFWYDLDDGTSTETLVIAATLDNFDRTIEEDELTYTTSPEPQMYEVCKEYNDVEIEDETEYYIEGWLAEKYVAVNENADILSKLLVEFEGDDKKTLSTGESWDLGSEFALTAQQIDLDRNKVWFSISKDGAELDSEVIDASSDASNQQRTYVYTEDIAGEDDVTVFLCYVDAVFRGTDTDIVQVKFAFLIDNEVLEIDTGDEFGIMEATANSGQITLRNKEDTLTLDEDSKEHIMGDMYFKTADDSNNLRFYPMVVKTEPGTYEIRGTVKEGTAANPLVGPANLTWYATNFAAFWYDLDEGTSTETLEIAATLDNVDRTIEEDEITYTTSPALQMYEVCEEYNDVEIEDETEYYIEGWLAEKYVAVNGNADILSKLLVEFKGDDKKTLSTGESWNLGGGFTLNATQIDLDHGTVLFSFAKDGVELDSEVINASSDASNQQRTYVYTEDIAGEDDVPVFLCYVDAVFRGTGTNIVQVKFAFLIDNEVLEIDTGDEFGIMEATANSDQITLRNKEDTLTLDEDSKEHIMGDMYFKTADDSDNLRFYPMVEYTIGGEEPTPQPGTIPATDTDGDGVPDVWDADNSTPAGYWVNPQGIGRMWGDMNGDGWLTSVDALMILQAAAGKIGL